MVLDKMVLNVLLSFTTLAILNFIGIGSSQHKLEQGLVIDCNRKSMKTQSPLQKFSKFDDKLCCFLDQICGDKCLSKIDWTCNCGDATFKFPDYKYCCIPINETCKTQGMPCKAE